MYHVHFGGAQSPGLPTEKGDLAFTLYLTKHSFLIIKKRLRGILLVLYLMCSLGTVKKVLVTCILLA